MTKKVLVTIGRQFGSGGLEIGKKLAFKFNIPYYDKDLIKIVAQNEGYDEEILHRVDEKSAGLFNSVLGNFAHGSASSAFVDFSMNDKLFLLQSDVIKKIASEKSAIFVGRCSDYVLENIPECVNVFIYSKLEDRIARISKKYEVTEAKAIDLIKRTDKTRAAFYNFYSGKKWGKATSYDLCINSSKIGCDNTVKLIAEYVESLQ